MVDLSKTEANASIMGQNAHDEAKGGTESHLDYLTQLLKNYWEHPPEAVTKIAHQTKWTAESSTTSAQHKMANAEYIKHMINMLADSPYAPFFIISALALVLLFYRLLKPIFWGIFLLVIFFFMVGMTVGIRRKMIERRERHSNSVNTTGGDHLEEGYLLGQHQ